MKRQPGLSALSEAQLTGETADENKELDSGMLQ